MPEEGLIRNIAYPVKKLGKTKQISFSIIIAGFVDTLCFKTKIFYFQSLQYQLRKLKHQVTENCHAVIFSMIVDVE